MRCGHASDVRAEFSVQRMLALRPSTRHGLGQAFPLGPLINHAYLFMAPTLLPTHVINANLALVCTTTQQTKSNPKQNITSWGDVFQAIVSIRSPVRVCARMCVCMCVYVVVASSVSNGTEIQTAALMHIRQGELCTTQDFSLCICPSIIITIIVLALWVQSSPARILSRYR